jgi:hypothetical protein
MTTTDRLERLATVLTTTQHSPSVRLYEIGLRLLASELADLANCTAERDRREEEDSSAGAAVPSRCPVARICDDSAERVRKIMDWSWRQ